MTDLEKMIRDALDSGETSGDLAKRLSNIMNKVEKERLEEEAKAKAVEEARINALQKRDDFVDKCVVEFQEHWDNAETTTARDAAIVALVAAMENDANEGWTLDEVKEFMDSVTHAIQLNLDMHEGNLDPKAKSERALKLFGENIKEALGETGIKSYLDGFPFGKSTLQKMLEESKEATRRSGDALVEWLTKQGW